MNSIYTDAIKALGLARSRVSLGKKEALEFLVAAKILSADGRVAEPYRCYRRNVDSQEPAAGEPQHHHDHHLPAS